MYFCLWMYFVYLGRVEVVDVYYHHVLFFFFKQKTEYEVRIIDWSSDVCSSDLPPKRAIAGLVGILIAAMMAGLHNRVCALALADVRGALGFGLDDASWLTTVYSAGEVIAMPFSAWFAITLSVRRFELWMIGTCTLLAVCIPFIHDLDLLLALRVLQGIARGTMISVLMMAALK